jgi:D-alanyl-D-alanine dipeptidase
MVGLADGFSAILSISMKIRSLCVLLCCLSLQFALAIGQAPQPLRMARQMLVVTTADWDAVPGHLQRFERVRPDQRWKPVGAPVAIVVGKNGMGWGAGLAAVKTPRVPGRTDPAKKEGDGKSPAGVFGIGAAFGTSAEPLAGLRLSYTPLTPTIECVDDPGSRSYNRIVDRATVTPDWSSSEHMAGETEAYHWGAVIEHNASPIVPGVGSCVFLHIWSGPTLGTAGCTAMEQDQLEPILTWLDPTATPILVQLPQAQYNKLKKPWGLPKLAR